MKNDLELKDDPNLLRVMLSDVSLQSLIYKPGPYWERSANASAEEIFAVGIGDFRGSSTLIGQGYSDNLDVDRRKNLRHGFVHKFFRWITTRIFPLNKIYKNQVNLTLDYAQRSVRYLGELLNKKGRTSELLAKYKIPYSLLGGCVSKSDFNQQEIAIHYLNILDKHDYASRFVDFGKAKSLLEIGGGFGANVHLLLANYENLRKVIYLDIPPNLYVGTQYLKSFFGAAVKDYRQVKESNSLEFSNDDSLEILCIAPWQIELLACEVDIFINSGSFVEMPKGIVKNYAEKVINRFPAQKTAVIVDSYGCFDLGTTFHPDELPGFFEKRNDFIRFQRETLEPTDFPYFYCVSPGDFGR